jgi:hypothetical protein
MRPTLQPGLLAVAVHCTAVVHRSAAAGGRCTAAVAAVCVDQSAHDADHSFHIAHTAVAAAACVGCSEAHVSLQ